MPATINKQRSLTGLLSATSLTMVSEAEVSAEPLPIFEQFVYGLCRENATPDQARQAYTNLKQRFFDWNEIRVSTVRELEEALEGLSDAEARAQKLVGFLQEVFEEKFSFELEGVQKKGVKQAGRSLAKYGAASDYVASWIVQRSLGGHAIPLDSATMRVARRLGLLDATQEDPEGMRTSLEHMVPKVKGQFFTDAISTIADRYCWESEPNCASCPLAADCPTAQETLGEPVSAAKTARLKR